MQLQYVLDHRVIQSESCFHVVTLLGQQCWSLQEKTFIGGNTRANLKLNIDDVGRPTITLKREPVVLLLKSYGK